MVILLYLLLLVFAYVVGSIPFAVIITKLKGTDIRNIGSKNTGAANVTGHVGKIYGVLVFFLDASKAAIPVFITYKYYNFPDWFIVLFSIMFIIGHDWSLFLEFNGGKGVSTSLGIAIVLFPIGYLIVFPFIVLISIIRKETNFASFLWFLLSPFVTYFYYGNGMFIVLSSLIFVVYIIRRGTYVEKYTLKNVISRIIFDHD